MSRSLYLINPRAESPGFFGAEAHARWGFPAAQSIADLSTTTVAALAPADWQVEICEENVQAVDFDTTAEFIGLTGKITQASRMLELAEEFRRRGKTVVVGGSYASLTPDTFRGGCDILVIGELEAIASEFFADLEASTWKEEYRAGRPELTLSPLPRWDLYPNERAMTGCIQTSRGCPFECEFCDVIQYLGRKQRHKAIEQILEELEVLYAIGYRLVFLADDNFTVYRRRAKEVLVALRDWNRDHAADPVAFATQVSIDATRDPEIMRLQAEAGMNWVFVGIETPNEESLKETKKRQNVGIDLAAEVQVFLDHGISVTGGMIVGFDSDNLDIFERQYEFAMSTAIPVFSMSALSAPAATPLYDRMKAAGRLVDQGPGGTTNPWDTNIVPNRMTREELVAGIKWLGNRLYHPEAFGQRLVNMIERLGPSQGPAHDPGSGLPGRPARAVEVESVALLRKLFRQGPEERKMWERVLRAMKKRPDIQPRVIYYLYLYAQVRCLYESGRFWEPQLASQATYLGASAPEPDASALVAIGK